MTSNASRPSFPPLFANFFALHKRLSANRPLFIFVGLPILFAFLAATAFTLALRNPIANSLHSIALGLNTLSDGLQGNAEHSDGRLATDHDAHGSPSEIAGGRAAQEGLKSWRAHQSNLLGSLQYGTDRNLPAGHAAARLLTPPECREWRKLAQTSSIAPFREHFQSLDAIDWFTYIAFFDEQFHARAAAQGRRPVYIDLAANHEKKYSNSWFFDRCMGWDGICAEANPKYHRGIMLQRHCHLVGTCVSDRVRRVNFSMTNEWGGVVKGGNIKHGIPGDEHVRIGHPEAFAGYRELLCTTLKNELARLGMKEIDFMSLDAQAHELPIMQGFDFRKARINVIVTENRGKKLKKLLERNGYTVHKDILRDYIYIHKDSGYSISQDALRLVRAQNLNLNPHPGFEDR